MKLIIINKLITNAGNSNQFYATKKLTRKDIPVSSMIEIKQGYIYRLEAWTNDS